MAFTQQDANGLVYFTPDAMEAAGGITHCFTSRPGGVSAGYFSRLNLGRSRNDDPLCVRENYRRVSEALSLPLEHLALCQQIHSDRVVTVQEEDTLADLYSPTPFEADALITNRPGITLAVFYADCIPVLLYDPIKQVIAAIHSGWRGTALNIAGKALQQMQREFGCDPATVLAAIGPGICPTCFETHTDVPQAMEAEMGSQVLPFVKPLPDGKFQVDLKGTIGHTLIQGGILPQHLSTLSLCTGCHPELFWSHRKIGEQRGNQAALISLRKEE